MTATIAKKKTKRTYNKKKPENDNLSKLYDAAKLVPDEYKGTDEFVDVLNWNIRFFHDKDKERVKTIVEILEQLNADVIVFEEIKEGALDVVAKKLQEREAGAYEVVYGTTGRDQRVAIMYDLDTIRAKTDFYELCQPGEVVTPDGKEVFPRLPLLGYFTALSYADETTVPFDFQLVGLHLKSQVGDGGMQRKMAADWLSTWLTRDSYRLDADVIMLGDFNQPPSAKAWQAFRDLEKTKKLAFSKINDESDFSHLMYRNRSEWGSKLDLAAISAASVKDLDGTPETVRWTTVDKLINGSAKASEIKDHFKQLRTEVSDHMPVALRFYFEDQG